jgi:hypothetical protein
MIAAPERARTVTVAPGAAGRSPTPLRADATPASARRLEVRVGNAGFARVAWAIHRTGRPGLAGIALLVAAALFLVSTHLPVVAEVEALRADLAATGSQARTAAAEIADPASAIRALPPREDMPAILRQLYGNALQAKLAVDSAKYEVSPMGTSGIVRYQVAFPVTGPYPRIRAFIDATLAEMPTVALNDFALDRKSISDGSVEAQIRLSVFTAAPARQESEPQPARQKLQIETVVLTAPKDRVVPPTHSSALFAQHSWYVLPKAPPPAPPPPPPEPTAPPFPYTYIGSFTPEGQPVVFFLSHGDRVIEARVGDRLDGVYQFESAAGGQLVFVYLPLNFRHTLPVGAPK